MRLRNKLLTGLAALVLASGVAKAETYNYSDDFSTDKVREDSYSHSGILTELPQYGNSPFLVLNYGRLTFYTGYTMYGDAVVYYKMPLRGETDGILSFGLALDVFTAFSYPNSGHLNVAVSENGTDWTELYENNNITNFDPPFTIRRNLINQMCENEYLRIMGMNISLDKLDVLINSDDIVPNGISSWGQIKSLYK